MTGLFRIFFLLLFVQFCHLPVALSGEYFDDSAVLHIDYPQWFRDSPFTDLSEDLEYAVAGNKKGLMVLFTTQGCSYCDIFIKQTLGDESIASVVRDNFESIGMEIFDDKEMTAPWGDAMPIKVFAHREKVEYSPTLLFYDKDGELVMRAVGYQSTERFRHMLAYVIDEHYRSVAFRDYLKQNIAQSPPQQMGEDLIQDPLFIQPPYALDRSRFAAEKPLMVIFEKRECSDCTVFHQSVLSDDNVRDTLAKFEVARFDIADNTTPVLSPSGQKIKPAQWYEKTGFTRVPAFLFFDEKGNEVLRTDALILNQRLMNSLNFVLERAYEKGWTYQRFARTKGAERRLKQQATNN